MKRAISRRTFSKGGAAAFAAALAVPAVHTSAESPNERIVVGVMGLSRGRALALTFHRQPNTLVKYVCDADRRRAEETAKELAKQDGQAQPLVDFRRILDDPEVDVLVVATPDHWHAPASILACAAGKHVYVEKPCSHNPAEGEMLVAAARKYNRQVQMGNQRRSWPAIQEAMQRLQEGVIGKVVVARTWYTALRGPIGRLKEAPVPDWLDWDLWQGPAPRVPYREGIVHYNWHWFWHWGTGEIGNNGVHCIDLARWGLAVDYPDTVTSGGGKLYFDDDQETPDTQVVTYLFGRKMIIFECRNWHRRGFEDQTFGASFFGDQGSLVIIGAGYRIYDRQDKLLEEKSGPGGDAIHIANFLDAIRGNAKLNSEILEGHKSTLLCHLGAISHRVGRNLRCRPEDGHILNDAEAAALWRREYEPGWEPKV
jgi:predicted dehydrogenase